MEWTSITIGVNLQMAILNGALMIIWTIHFQLPRQRHPVKQAESNHGITLTMNQIYLLLNQENVYKETHHTLDTTRNKRSLITTYTRILLIHGQMEVILHTHYQVIRLHFSSLIIKNSDCRKPHKNHMSLYSYSNTKCRVSNQMVHPTNTIPHVTYSRIFHSINRIVHSANHRIFHSTSSNIHHSLSTILHSTNNRIFRLVGKIVLHLTINVTLHSISNIIFLPSTNNIVLRLTSNRILPSTNNKIISSTSNKIHLSTSNRILLSTSNRFLPSTNNGIHLSNNSNILPSTSNNILPSTNNKIHLSTNYKLYLSTNNRILASTDNNNAILCMIDSKTKIHTTTK